MVAAVVLIYDGKKLEMLPAAEERRISHIELQHAQTRTTIAIEQLPLLHILMCDCM